MWKKFKQWLAEKLELDAKIHYENLDFMVNNETFAIREMQVDDAKSLLDVERLVYHGEMPWTKSIFIAEMHSPIPHLYLSLFTAEKLVGFIGARFLGSDAHITNIAVLPNYQKKGLGTILLDEIEKYARLSHCDSLTLEVRMSNYDAQRLYRKKGYVSRSVKQGYYTETNEDALDMIKHLDSGAAL